MTMSMTPSPSPTTRPTGSRGRCGAPTRPEPWTLPARCAPAPCPSTASCSSSTAPSGATSRPASAASSVPRVWRPTWSSRRSPCPAGRCRWAAEGTVDRRGPMPDSPMTFERYDERVAAGLVKAHEKAGGLPGFLGLRIVETWPGGLRTELEVRDELLTPFGNLHGGVLAALVDHALGTVCYPVIAPGSWAATTEFKLNYLAPVTSGTISAVSQVVSL